MVAWKQFLLASLAAAAFAGCNREAKSDAPAERSANQRASIGSLTRKLDEASDRLQVLETKATQAGSEVGQDLRDEIAKLAMTRDQLYERLKDLQSAGADGWEGLKDDAASGVDSLGRAVNRTWKDVTAGERSAEAEVESKDR
jgi:septal ring factor EnvC (AmiA/AmiB activator)